MAEPERRVPGLSEDPAATERRVSLTPTVSDRPRGRPVDHTLPSRLSNPAAAVEPAPRGDPKEYLQALSLGVTAEHPGRYLADAEARELGRGGLGRVFVALDQHLGREVAMKELLPEVIDGGNSAGALQAISRFLREARVTGQLDHPNIVPVYELGRRADGRLYYTMRVVRGRTLARAIADAATLAERLALMPHFSGLCQAIAYAHSRGVVHRDIKPENVMVGDFGETVVLDWGMAKLRDREAWENELQGNEPPAPLHEAASGELTIEGTLCGTPIYMSPEQAQGQVSEVDERSDVWSLGVVLYTLIAGRPPFSGKMVSSIALELWDVRARRKRWEPPAFASGIAALALGSSAGSLLVALVDGSVRWYRAPGTVPLFERRVAEPRAVALSPDDRRIAVGTERGGVLAFEVGGGPGFSSTLLGQSVATLAFAPDGVVLAVAGELGAVSAWHTASGVRRDFEGHDGTVRVLDFAQNGRYFASAGADRAIRFWDTASGQQLSAPIVHTDAVTSMAWSDDARFVVYGSKDKSFSIRDLRRRAARGRGARSRAARLRRRRGPPVARARGPRGPAVLELLSARRAALGGRPRRRAGALRRRARSLGRALESA